MSRLILAIGLLFFAQVSFSAGGYCYNSKTSARQAGPGCLEAAWSIADEKWKSEYPSSVSCATFNTSVAPMSGGTGYSRVRKNTSLSGCASGGYYGHETTCLDGYSPNESLTQCVANVTCTEGTTYDPATGQCSLTEPPQDSCEFETGNEFTMESTGEQSGCLNGCQVDWLPTTFDFGGSKYWTGKFTGATCIPDHGELPPMLPLDDPDAPLNCIVDGNGNSLCYNYTDAELKCGKFNEVRVCEDMFPPSGCGYVNGKYGCVTQTAPETTQLPTTKEGLERMPEWILEGDEYNTWIWETNNWTEGTNPSGTSDHGEQLKLDGIAKEATLQGLVNEVRQFNQNEGVPLLQPSDDGESWPQEIDNSDAEGQLSQLIDTSPFEAIVDSVSDFAPDIGLGGLQAKACVQWQISGFDRTFTIPNDQWCTYLELLRSVLAWVFAAMAGLKIYEMSVMGTKQ